MAFLLWSVLFVLKVVSCFVRNLLIGEGRGGGGGGGGGAGPPII